MALKFIEDLIEIITLIGIFIFLLTIKNDYWVEALGDLLFRMLV